MASIVRVGMVFNLGIGFSFFVWLNYFHEGAAENNSGARGGKKSQEG